MRSTPGLVCFFQSGTNATNTITGLFCFLFTRKMCDYDKKHIDNFVLWSPDKVVKIDLDLDLTTLRTRPDPTK